MNTQQKNKGFVLFVSLVFLALLSILGVIATRSAATGERMANSVRDRQIAFNSAEAALADAEEYLGLTGTPAIGTKKGLIFAHPRAVTGDLWLDPTADAIPLSWDPAVANGPTIVGLLVNNAALPYADTAQKARYFIENAGIFDGAGCGKTPDAICKFTEYRITARGVGQSLDDDGNPSGTVILQRAFKVEE